MTTLTTGDGLRLHLQHWPAPGPAHGTVQIVHGLGEHIGRYEALAAALNAEGWHVAGHDHRGHGRSEGARGTIARRHDFHYAMGMGHERQGWPVEWLGGRIYATEDVSEQNQRAFYMRWAAMMDDVPGQSAQRVAAE